MTRLHPLAADVKADIVSKYQNIAKVTPVIINSY